MDEKFCSAKKAVFAMMNEEMQKSVPFQLNPLLSSLEKQARRFLRDAMYYDYGEPRDFNEAFGILKANDLNIASLKAFQKFVARRLIADTYHVNSYVQESLVDVYRTVDEVINFLGKPRGNDLACTKAEELFYRLTKFEDRLEESLQRGPVRWGFLKARKFVHWDIVVVFRYFYSLLWFCPATGCRCAPIEKETAALLQQVRQVANENQRLCREIRDFETLYWATRESDIASLIFVSASLTFVASVIFTTAWIFSIRALTDLAFLSTAVASFGAILAMSHLFRKFFILARLGIVLRKKDREVTEDRKSDLALVRSVTYTQLLLTLALFCTASAAAIALALSVAQNAFGGKIATPKDLPFWIAMGALLTAIGSTIFFFFVDFVVRYKLTTELGPFVCSIFKNEINEIHQSFVVDPTNSVDTKHVQEVETWEYTARGFLHKYRLDTVFAADRFGQILQYIQSGGIKNHST